MTNALKIQLSKVEISMKLNKILLAVAAFALLISAIPQSSSAQWSIGASYEIREEAPENGFGVRLERGLLQKAPLIDLRLRGHFSYFSEDNYADESGNARYGKIENYDFGLAAVAGVSIGLLTPYVGTGLGSTTTELKNPEGAFDEDSESNVYWNGFVGAEVSPIPVLKPFVEYRFQAVEDFKDLQGVDRSNGRLIFGLSLAF